LGVEGNCNKKKGGRKRKGITANWGGKIGVYDTLVRRIHVRVRYHCVFAEEIEEAGDWSVWYCIVGETGKSRGTSRCWSSRTKVRRSALYMI